MKPYLVHELKRLGIALSMVPFCFLLLLIYFVLFAPATTTASSGINWNNALQMSVLFGAIPGILLAGGMYTVMNIFYPYQAPRS